MLDMLEIYGDHRAVDALIALEALSEADKTKTTVYEPVNNAITNSVVATRCSRVASVFQCAAV